VKKFSLGIIWAAIVVRMSLKQRRQLVGSIEGSEVSEKKRTSSLHGGCVERQVQEKKGEHRGKKGKGSTDGARTSFLKIA